MTGSNETIREKVREIADRLAPDATWEDVIYQVALRRSIEQGLAEADAGLVVPVEELLRDYGAEE